MSAPIPATVIVLTKNEERNIARAIRSASEFDEVLVVDSSSTDETVPLAVDAGARVIQFDWNGHYPKKKEWALTHAAHDWVVYLDADETLSRGLVRELESLIRDPDVAAVDVGVRYYWLGTPLRHGHRVSKRIAIRRSRCQWPRPDDLGLPGAWEVEGHYQPFVTGRVSAARALLHHDDRDPISTWFDRHNRYSDWEAALRLRVGRGRRDAHAVSRRGRVFARVPFKPLAFFLYSYVARLGFLDGRAGFDYAFALSAYYWQIGLKERDLRRRGLRP